MLFGRHKRIHGAKLKLLDQLHDVILKGILKVFYLNRIEHFSMCQ